jgi:hypothetical protein
MSLPTAAAVAFALMAGAARAGEGGTIDEVCEDDAGALRISFGYYQNYDRFVVVKVLRNGAWSESGEVRVTIDIDQSYKRYQGLDAEGRTTFWLETFEVPTQDGTYSASGYFRALGGGPEFVDYFDWVRCRNLEP